MNRIVRIILLALVFLITVTFLLVALTPFLDPGRFWFIAALGWVYPALVVMVLICLIVLAIARSKWFFLPLAALLLSWQQLSVLFRYRSSVKAEKPANSFRLLCWNVTGWTESRETARKENWNKSFRDQMLNVVKLQNADVICLQEFFESYDTFYFRSNIPVLVKMGYPYYYFSPASKLGKNKFQSGLMILSRYPIVDSAYFKQVSGGHSEGFSYADIRIGTQTLRFFNTHLESAGFSRSRPGELAKQPRSFFARIRSSYRLRAQQVAELRKEMDRSPHPSLLCGDLDDVPNSYVYFKARGAHEDAFLKKGSGIGGTIKLFSPTFRIDYIFTDPRIRVLNFKKQDYDYSDHYPLVADLQLK